HGLTVVFKSDDDEVDDLSVAAVAFTAPSGTVEEGDDGEDAGTSGTLLVKKADVPSLEDYTRVEIDSVEWFLTHPPERESPTALSLRLARKAAMERSRPAYRGHA
ncbi:unnamed protein product, partial [marine sediment metagenome]